ncbi:hypothetical protein JMUB7507_26400 [Staphylococcus aureus]
MYYKNDGVEARGKGVGGKRGVRKTEKKRGRAGGERRKERETVEEKKKK